jgi:hypothetical protein
MDDAARPEREWTQIIRGEFLEIPGLRLTKTQIQRLWGLHSDACESVLDALLQQRFLQLTADGYYVRAGRNGPRSPAPHAESLVRELAVGRR